MLSIWRRADDVLTRRTPLSILVMPPGASEPLRLQGAAAYVWEALEQPASDERLTTLLGARFVVSNERVRADIAATTAILAECGAIVVADV